MIQGEGAEQRFRLALYQDHGTIFFTQKALCDHVVEEGEQRVVVAPNRRRRRSFSTPFSLRTFARR